MPPRCKVDKEAISFPYRPSLDLLLLSWLAGMMDALSYLHSGVFTANMTGNSVVLGLALIGPDRSKLLRSALAIGSFSAGALIAAIVLIRLMRGDEWRREIQLGCLIELPFVLIASILWLFSPPPMRGWMRMSMIGSAACALGIQSVAVRRLRVSGVVTTFITGTLTATLVSVVSKREPAAQREERRPPVLLASMLVCYVLAAAVAAFLAYENRELAGAIPVALLVAVEIRSFRA